MAIEFWHVQSTLAGSQDRPLCKKTKILKFTYLDVSPPVGKVDDKFGPSLSDGWKRNVLTGIKRKILVYIGLVPREMDSSISWLPKRSEVQKEQFAHVTSPPPSIQSQSYLGG